MINVISHRGYWIDSEEKNSEVAFRRAFSNGFGVETDLRDFNGEVVISHDMPVGKVMTFDYFLQLYCEYDKELTLALNIKSDGLAKIIKDFLLKYQVSNYFLFDMSAPDQYQIINENLYTYSRISDFENQVLFENDIKGIWLDAFKSVWYNQKDIEKLLETYSVCVVSSELHGREYMDQWKLLSNIIGRDKEILICTDKPVDAEIFFGGKND